MIKKSAFITLFVSTHIVFIFLHIHKYSQVVKASYEKQKNGITLETLRQRKQDLTHKWYALQNRTAIKQFAVNTMKMEPITLNQIKKMNTHESQQTI
jgi:hypothetical protein